MKLILDLDEKTIENMHEYTSARGITINELITELFNTTIQHPAETLLDIGTEGLSEFRETLFNYMNEAIYDIEESAHSEEAYDTDVAMIAVFKKLMMDHLVKGETLADLYKTYKEEGN